MYFEIQVDDLERAKHFYSHTLGWKFELAEGLPIEYWRISGPGLMGGMLKRPCPPPAPMQGTNAFVVSFEVKNLSEISEKILAVGGQVAMEKFAVPGKCYQAYFIDPENNTFGLFEPDPNAK